MRLLLFACAVVTGCASPAPEAPPLGPGEILSARAAQDALVVGKSSKAQVRAALGEATVVDFDSGYEVWLYRERPPEKTNPRRTELVLLFAPSGTLAKTRTR